MIKKNCYTEQSSTELSMKLRDQPLKEKPKAKSSKKTPDEDFVRLHTQHNDAC